jgi:hypothetical protein
MHSWVTRLVAGVLGLVHLAVGPLGAVSLPCSSLRRVSTAGGWGVLRVAGRKVSEMEEGEKIGYPRAGRAHRLMV